METGVSIIPPLKFADGRFSLSFAEYDSQILFYALYFRDITVAPINIEMFGTGLQTSTILEQTLVDQEVVRAMIPWNVRINSALDENFLARYTAKLFDQLNDGDRQCAVATTEQVNNALQLDDISCIVMTLRKFLPCPRADVPYSEILDFRESHSAELERFHRGINRAFFQYRGTLSQSEALSILSGDTADAVLSIRNYLKKNKIPFISPDFSVSFSIPMSLIAGAVAQFAHSKGVPLADTLSSLAVFELGKSRLSKGGNRYPAEFQYVLSGVRAAVAEAFPDDQLYIDDIESMHVANSAFAGGYPERMRVPSPSRHNDITHCVSDQLEGDGKAFHEIVLKDE